MEIGRHENLGESRGNPLQPQGRHRDLAMPRGVGFIPLGDRHRDITEYGIRYEEERGSVDKYTKYT
jgi:hypothetical protein